MQAATGFRSVAACAGTLFSLQEGHTWGRGMSPTKVSGDAQETDPRLSHTTRIAGYAPALATERLSLTQVRATSAIGWPLLRIHAPAALVRACTSKRCIGIAPPI